MARSGINKALVLRAIESLIEKGKKPTIDSVRSELGDTGSKSTIHRFMSEIDEENTLKRVSKSPLSEPIGALVSRLADTLKEEANIELEEQKVLFEKASSEQTKVINKHETTIAQLEAKLLDIKSELQEANAHNQDQTEKYEKLAIVLREVKQSNEKLEILVQEKDKQIESLDEKHQHSRQSLNHYRESVKDQREQDQRNHEKLLQQSLVEIRALNQTISVKQNDITQLNKDNGRLSAELTLIRKAASSTETENHKMKDTISNLTAKAESLQRQHEQSSDLLAKLPVLEKEYEKLRSTNDKALIQIAKLESEVAVKTAINESLIKSQGPVIDDKERAKKTSD